MPPQGTILGPQTLQRILSAVGFVESLRQGGGWMRGGPPNGLTHPHQEVLVTSATPTGGRYPGKWLIRDEPADQWIEKEEIWVRERNNATLTTKRYLGRQTGGAPDGKAVFIVDATATAPLGCDIQPVGCEADCGESILAAREDHVHAYTFGTDIQPVGDTNDPGNDCLPARSDHVHAFEWPTCSAITVYETDILCQNYSLNVYIRAVTINIVEGCLTKSVGSWVLDHSAGCCDCCELYWCVGCECVQACERPEGATAGPFATAEACALACYEPYWCVDCGCVQACEEPVGATGGPFATLVACEAACYQPWWCVDEACVQSCTAPVGYTSGPHASEAVCLASGCVPPPEACCSSLPVDMLATFSNISNCACAAGVTAPTSSPGGATFNGSTDANFCGGMRQIDFSGTCTGDSIEDYELTWSISDAGEPACSGGASGVPVLLDPYPTCDPLSLWFEITLPGECCGGTGSSTIRLHITEAP